MNRLATVLTMLLAAALALALAPASAQVAGELAGQAEPAHTCVAAQAGGALDVPLRLDDSLEGPPPLPGGTPNIDFYKLRAAPGETLQITLSGDPSVGAPLEYPYLGVFTSDCTQLYLRNLGGEQDARMFAQAPDDGFLIVAATSCCDSTFTTGGYGGGNYTLEVADVGAVPSISGTVIDSATGLAPTGTVTIWLDYCGGDGCTYYAYATLDSQGRFAFINSPSTEPTPGPADPSLGDNPTYIILPAGPYQVNLFAPLYDLLPSISFVAEVGLPVALDEIALQKLPLIGSISGRLVDPYTGEGLSGVDAPYAWATLLKCESGGCFAYFTNVPTDEAGFFSFHHDPYAPLTPGQYAVAYGASQYVTGVTEPFDVGEGEHYAAGTLKVKRQPLQVGAITGCPSPPASGGTCEWTVELINLLPEAVKLNTWATYTTFGAWAQVESQFQPEPAQQFTLRPQRTRTVRFKIAIPADMPLGAILCADVYASEATRGSYFTPSAAMDYAFCVTKAASGGLRQLTEGERADLALRARGIQPGGHGGR